MCFLGVYKILAPYGFSLSTNNAAPYLCTHTPIPPCHCAPTHTPPKTPKGENRERGGAMGRAHAGDPDVIATIWGSLLGDGWGERRALSTRLHLHASTKNMGYISAFHNFFSSRGLASPKRPKINKCISKGSTVYYTVKVRTYSYKEWNWIWQAFYGSGNKRVPLNCQEMLTPRALAIWYADDGGLSGVGCQLHTDSFSRECVERLQHALCSRWGLHWTIQRHKKNYTLYLPWGECEQFAALVRPHLCKSMHYKLRFR